MQPASEAGREAPSCASIIFRAPSRSRILLCTHADTRTLYCTPSGVVLSKSCAQAVRRLEEIEELRRKARARKIDREMRKDEFIALVQRSAICLQRAERRRQFRAKIRRRMAASFKLIRWARAKIQRALILKATRNRNVLKIMVDVSCEDCLY